MRTFAGGAGVGPLDLSIDAGEFVSIVGPSGCGKSLLIDLIGGLTACDAGEVRVGGTAVRGPSGDRQIVFQDGELFPWLTVEGNIAYGLHARGENPVKIASAVEAFLHIVRLEKVAHLYPHELSNSMRQRTAIARALVLRPPVLLLDDPLAALDEVTRAILQREIADLWQLFKSTTVLVTHNVAEACLLGDRVVVLSASPGQVVEIAEVDASRPRTLDDVDGVVARVGMVLRTQVYERGDDHESLAGTMVHRIRPHSVG
ncbi:MAG TPA: ABC transporter ATP-binding protein [Candidatus Eremiobacteraceae bacterium]